MSLRLLIYSLLGLLCLELQAQNSRAKDYAVAIKLESLGEFSRAKEYYQRAENRKPSDTTKAGLGRCLYNLRDFQSYYKVARSRFMSQRSTSAAVQLAQASFSMGRYDECLRILNRTELENWSQSKQLQQACDSASKWKRKPQDYRIQKLKKLNSPYSDVAPSFHAGSIAFSSGRENVIIKKKYGQNEDPFYDLYIVNSKGKAVRFSDRINSLNHEAACTFSSNDSVIYFTRSQHNAFGKNLNKSDVNRLKLYKSVCKKSGWTKPEWFIMNDSLYSYGHPCMSPDGKVFFFSSDQPGGYGGTDLYVCLNVENIWSAPINLGAKINTSEDESFPFFHSSGLLYFSSNGHIGMGGYDIFKATLTDGEYQNVRNLGHGINSSHDDFSFIINDQLEKGYFSSNRPGGQGKEDIYKIEKIQFE